MSIDALRPLPARVLDVHHHVGSLNVGLAGESEGSEQDGVPHRHVEMLDRFGYTAAAVMPGLQYERPRGIVDTRAVNDAIAAYRDANPRRFPLAMGTAEPLHGTAIAVEEVTRAAVDLRLDGLVWHTRYQGVAISDHRMHELVDAATAHGLPCLVHMFCESLLEAPWMMADLAKAHPDATIVVLDGFSSATQAQYVYDLADRFPALLFDTAICFPLLRLLDRFVERFGAGRLLFGTDSYADPVSYNHPAVRDELRASSLTDDQLQQVFWGNAARVFPALASRVGPTGQR
ncbi:amidohydrolase family protein [Qaidamihabitans albus]|uniref:amidohydrolase family protein n=1 Tax=Qaidamihabitans albus TaxID=2795733 RepID=UPI0018F1891E|nr:amidohydrolase family protein [Qaidamihabitans albus]